MKLISETIVRQDKMVGSIYITINTFTYKHKEQSNEEKEKGKEEIKRGQNGVGSPNVPIEQNETIYPIPDDNQSNGQTFDDNKQRTRNKKNEDETVYIYIYKIIQVYT